MLLDLSMYYLYLLVILLFFALRIISSIYKYILTKKPAAFCNLPNYVGWCRANIKVWSGPNLLPSFIGLFFVAGLYAFRFRLVVDPCMEQPSLAARSQPRMDSQCPFVIIKLCVDRWITFIWRALWYVFVRK